MLPELVLDADVFEEFEEIAWVNPEVYRDKVKAKKLRNKLMEVLGDREPKIPENVKQELVDSTMKSYQPIMKVFHDPMWFEYKLRYKPFGLWLFPTDAGLANAEASSHPFSSA